MSSAVGEVPTTTLLARLDDTFTELMQRAHTSASDRELLDTWAALGRVRSRIDAVETGVIAEVDTRGVAQARNIRSTAGLARVLLRLAPGEAHARVKAARALGPRTTLLGEVIEPAFPQAAAALAAGEISLRHAQVITDAITKLPDELREEVHDTVETHLVGTAYQVDPFRLAQHASDLVAALDQDGRLREEASRDRTRHFDIHERPDGSSRVDGELTAEATEVLRTVLDVLAKPAPEADGVKDARTPSQRRHDGLLAGLKAAIRAGQIPAGAGITTTVLLIADSQDWQTGSGNAQTGHGARVSTREARQWAGGDYRTMTVNLDQRGGIEGWTDARRLFSESQRLAIIARDKGCTTPGCDAPPQYCEVHHVIEHSKGGPTTVENGALVCTWNHANFEDRGWQCVMLEGTPHWIPPRWLDPTQTPQRNTMHDH